MSSFYGASGGDEGDERWGPGGCTSLHQLHGLRPLALSQILAKKKRQEKIVMCTAYDLFTARVADDAMVDLLLVGDSLANVVLGEPRTTAVDLDTMIMFAKLVTKGAKRAAVIFDLPYGTYKTPEEAAASTAKVVQATGIQIVKLEGHAPDVVRATCKHAVVCCHLGLLPQTATSFTSSGGTVEEAEMLLHQALELQEAGASLLVLEMVCAEAAQLISENLRIPTIGIGAGAGCDGQVLVIHDMLGLCAPGAKQYMFVKRYANLYNSAVSAVEAYRSEVVEGSFPQKCNAPSMKPGEREKFAASCARRASALVKRSESTEHEGSGGEVPAHSDARCSTERWPAHSNALAATGTRCAAALQGACETLDDQGTRPYRICVWGGGRMGQLFAWILSGPAHLQNADSQELKSWQRLQLRGTEVSLCTGRQDLLAASAENGGFVEAHHERGEAHDSDTNAGTDAQKVWICKPEEEDASTFMLANKATEGLTNSKALGERRQVKVISRVEAEKLERAFDLVIIACHSTQTQEVAECAFRGARVGGMVASLQNGLKAPRLLRALHDRQLLSGVRRPLLHHSSQAMFVVATRPCCIAVFSQGNPPALVFMPNSLAAVENAPLVIQQRGSGSVRICGHLRRSFDAAEQLYAMLLSRGVSCELLPNHRLDEVLWEKAAVNCFINPLTALLNCLNAQLTDSRLQLASLPVLQASACAAAHAVACATRQNVSSTLGQLREGRPLELADISGEVVREATLIGLKAPVNRLLLELVGLLEATRTRCLSN
ncbi:hypothetical protein Efla_004879 [Eimeria flavescens]